MDLEVERRRPCLPVIHSAKAFKVTSGSHSPQVRCFYALAHREHNPHDSEYHMEARLGFRRTTKKPVRLRPLEDVPKSRPPLRQMPGAPGTMLFPKKQNLQSADYKVDSTVAAPPRGLPAAAKAESVFAPGPCQGLSSPPANSATSAAVVADVAPVKRSQSREGASPPSDMADSRPATAFAPEQGQVDWTEYECMTQETLSTLLENAEYALGEPTPGAPPRKKVSLRADSFGLGQDDGDSDAGNLEGAIVDVTDGFSKVGTDTAWRSIQKGFEGAFDSP
mmetsp:Transcript_69401/g.166391  ORF Transcript_69401/g.166391 Transcript_69401/m.166391 type:complete len:279 (+) Transcript_69401:87-923(+)